MKSLDERGSILAQVIVSILFMAVIAATVLRARLQPSMNAANAVSRVAEDLAARAAISRVTEVWTRLGSCATDNSVGVVCPGGVPGADCNCTVGGVNVTADYVATASGGYYSLSVAKP
ncbi:MAG: hypothetical protein HY403_11140 [Elusimicrobia bacterium]|nr:hypothetical protein [Elusimicrobiota bacterium]